MAPNLYLATSGGLAIAEGSGGDWRVVGRALEGDHATSVIAREGVILIGTRRGVFRSDDGGRTWDDASAGLAHRHVRWLAYHPDRSDLEFAGTEPATIFVSHDGARSWRQCEEVAALRDRLGWFLPYSPAAGCVRSFTLQGNRGYAAVEVGGLLRSDDGGETWALAVGSDGIPRRGRPLAGRVHPDVHSVVGHPSSADLVYCPTGGGFYCSRDGGQAWECRYDCYCRAVWVDPADPDRLILGPADGVDRNGRVEESRDGGASWQVASDGLGVPWPRDMVERFAQVGDQLLAALSGGQLFAAPLATLIWRRILPDIAGVSAAATMAG
ncbi:MAG: hypothetical protein IPO81_16315 [Kouleothrix sp.]|nr:hypothetical protein [Kouleothrix sp.]